eukprot:3335510-Prymnesium_polylepis.4
MKYYGRSLYIYIFLLEPGLPHRVCPGVSRGAYTGRVAHPYHLAISCGFSAKRPGSMHVIDRRSQCRPPRDRGRATRRWHVSERAQLELR